MNRTEQCHLSRGKTVKNVEISDSQGNKYEDGRLQTYNHENLKSKTALIKPQKYKLIMTKLYSSKKKKIPF